MPRAVKYLLWTLLGLCILVIAAGFLIGVVYEDEVKADLQAQLNTHLKAPVSVGEMDLTLFSRFPNVALHLKNVLAKEAIEEKVFPDTLLYAEDLYFEFGLLELISGEFKVKELHADKICLYPGLNEEGKPNYLIWEARGNSDQSIAVDLDQLSFNDLQLRYRDASEAFELVAFADELELNGRFDGTADRLAIKGDLLIDHLHHGEQQFLSNTQTKLKAELDLSGKEGPLKVTQAELVVSGTPLLVDLLLSEKAKVDHIALQATGKALDLEEVASLFPPIGPELLKKYGVSGNTDVVLNYSGPLSKENGPALSLAVELREGRMKELNSGAVFKEIQGRAFAKLNSSGELVQLELDRVQAKAASGKLAVSGSMNGRTPAQVNGTVQCNVDLADLLRFMRIEDLEQISGQLLLDLNVAGKVRDVQQLALADLSNISITGGSSIRGGSAKLRGMKHRVSDLNADLQMNGRDAKVKSLTADLQGSRIALEGTFHDLVPYLLFKDQKLLVEAKFSSPKLDLAQLLVDEPSTTTTKRKDYELILPSQIELDLQVDVDHLVFNTFNAKEVSGAVRVRDKRLFADPVMFATAGGKLEGKLELDGRKKGTYPLKIKATLDDIDVAGLFQEFDEFGQHFITSQHLRGTVNSFVDFSSVLTPALQFDMGSIRMVADITIDDGQLVEHGPMIEIADYIRSNVLIAPFVNIPELEKKLHNIQFSTLNNRIEIRDRAVIIPDMEVKSTALNISLSGSHSFDGQIDQHVNFRLADVLSKPNKKEEFGPIVDDGTGSRIYLHMYGPTNDLQFRNDRQAIAENRKATLSSESKTLKAIIGQKTGLFKGDTTLTNAIPPDDSGPAPQFQVDWSEDAENPDEIPKEVTQPAAEKQQKRNGIDRLFDKIGGK